MYRCLKKSIDNIKQMLLLVGFTLIHANEVLYLFIFYLIRYRCVGNQIYLYNKYFLPAARHADCKMNISRENTAADDDGHIESNPEGVYQSPQ